MRIFGDVMFVHVSMIASYTVMVLCSSPEINTFVAL